MHKALLAGLPALALVCLAGLPAHGIDLTEVDGQNWKFWSEEQHVSFVKGLRIGIQLSEGRFGPRPLGKYRNDQLHSALDRILLDPRFLFLDMYTLLSDLEFYLRRKDELDLGK